MERDPWVIFTIELEPQVANTAVFDVVINKLGHRQELDSIVLLQVEKKL